MGKPTSNKKKEESFQFSWNCWHLGKLLGRGNTDILALIIFRITCVYAAAVFCMKVISSKRGAFPGIEPFFFSKPEEKSKSCALP